MFFCKYNNNKLFSAEIMRAADRDKQMEIYHLTPNYDKQNYPISRLK